MSPLTLAVTLRPITCGSCGGTYAIAERYAQEKQDKAGYWTCPYCKIGWGYGEGENAKLKRQLAEAETRSAREKASHDQTRAALKTAELKAAREKAKAARVKNRITHGVCPCCHRTFQALARHMKTKHPEYVT